MLEGITKSGFEFAVPDRTLNDMELLEDLAAMSSGDATKLPEVCTKILGKEQKKRLYEHVRTEGVVPIDKVSLEITEILQSGNQGKN